MVVEAIVGGRMLVEVRGGGGSEERDATEKLEQRVACFMQRPWTKHTKKIDRCGGEAPSP